MSDSDPSKPLAGRVAVVTGAGRGLGRVAAEALGAAGASVVVAGRSIDGLEEVASHLRSGGAEALVVPTDVTDGAGVEALAARTLAELGTVDVLVNNSGVAAVQRLVDTSDEEWDRVFDTNVRGTFLVTRAFGPTLIAQRAGKVINVASNFGVKGVANMTAYTASKAAVIGFTKSLALEWARHNIQVNALAPGYFETAMNADVRADDAGFDRVLTSIPARRMGRPDELASWFVLLASGASDFMTGATIVVDGGQSAQ